MDGILIFASMSRIIIKTIIKNVFNDPAADIADEYFVERFKDYIKARKAKRHFDILLDKLSENLDSFAESVRMTKEEKEFYSSKVEQIFSDYDFSLENIISKDFNAEEILDDVVKVSFSDNHQYSEKEWSQLRAFIRMAVNYTVESSRSMENFNELTNQEILKRTNTIIRMMKKMLDDFEKNLRDIKKEQSLQMSSIELQYKSIIRRIYSRISVFGASLSADTRRYLVEEAYVTLHATDGEGDMLAIDEYLEHDYLAVFGEAGTGKTTFVNWLAICSSIYGENLPCNEWEMGVPFVIELRKHRLPISLATIKKTVTDLISNSACDDWISDIFSQGRAILLIDGLDEIPANQREDVLHWIMDIKSQFKLKILITSRPSGLEYDYIFYQDNFKIVSLEPMSDDITATFIKNWHMAVSKNFSWNTKEAEEYSKALHASIRSIPSLKSLASYPLLCAMLCGLWHNRDMVLPKTRNELYEECCKMLLEGRDYKRRITHPAGDAMTEVQKFIIMESIAYWYQVNNYSASTSSHVKRKITDNIKSMSVAINEIGSTNILEYLIERSGIIRNPSRNDIDFIHKTFQEYLAARVIVRNSDFGILLNNVLDHNWRETFLLALGMASHSQADEIITSLLERASHDKCYACYAVAGYNIPAQLSPNVRKSVISITPSVIPPKNESEARLLSVAPETIVPFLRYNSDYDEDELKYCIRTLILINTVQSLSALSEYFNCCSSSLQSYILNASEQMILRDVVDSGLATELISHAFNKEKSTAIISTHICELCHVASSDITNEYDKYLIKSLDAFEFLGNIGEINNAEWLYSRVEIECLDASLEDVKLRNLSISFGDKNYSEVPLSFLWNFGKINELTLHNIDIDKVEVFALDEIKGMVKLHICNPDFVIDECVSELLACLKTPVILEITTEKIIVGYYSVPENPLNIKELIINCKEDRKHFIGNDEITNYLEDCIIEYEKENYEYFEHGELFRDMESEE